MAGRKTKRGTSGNAARYVTRNQALKKLQLHLGEFRRLCILKGIHPREPNKKTQGQNKTYYHVKDLAFLAHEPLIHKLRQQHAYEKKIRKAKAKRNAELAKQLAERRPTYTLDRLVKERYPSFIDALRDLDDPLTLTHLFAVLPAEGAHNIPSHQVAMARQLALEWQAYVVRAHALRKVFVSVKGFYFQAEVMGQSITWLVPHQLAQVLPTDVDYRVMLTFLEFYATMLRFVHFRLYHSLGVTYPPRVDPKLDAAATGIAALMADLAAAAAPASAAQPVSQAAQPQQQPAVLPTAVAAALSPAAAAAAASESEDSDADEAALSIDSGAEDSDEDLAGGSDDEAPPGIAGSSPEASDAEEAVTEPLPQRHAVAAAQAAAQPVTAAGPSSAAAAAVTLPQSDAAEPPTTAAGGAVGVPADDDAAVCATLFQGLVFFLGREVPREPLLLVIRSFGGSAAWAGEGSPLDEADESITHQVVDRPTQGHRFLSRQYVQPQWVFDSANFRVLADAAKYAPGAMLPPHLSPFVTTDAADEEEHVPDYALELRRLQDAAKAARERAAGAADQQFLEEAAGGAASANAPAQDDGEVQADAAEAQYHAELRAELQAGRGEVIDEEPAAAGVPTPATPAAAAADDEDAAMADIMLTRKKRKLYNSVVKAKSAKRARAGTLKARAAAAAAGNTSS